MSENQNKGDLRRFSAQGEEILNLEGGIALEDGKSAKERESESEPEVRLIHGDCLEALRTLPDGCVDLAVTDPPYEFNDEGGTNTRIGASFRKIKLAKQGLTEGFDPAVLDELCRVMRKINIYVFCNMAQIPMYLDYFVKGKGARFDILIWWKRNSIPSFSNKYLSDKEYCLYFRKGGWCMPRDYDRARTVWDIPMNVQDKERWGHPTIKPLPIIRTLVENSSKPGETVLDPFMGSGTTGVAAAMTGRGFIGMEREAEWFSVAQRRIAAGKAEKNTLFPDW